MSSQGHKNFSENLRSNLKNNSQSQYNSQYSINNTNLNRSVMAQRPQHVLQNNLRYNNSSKTQNNVKFSKTMQRKIRNLKNHPAYSSIREYKGKVLDFMREYKKQIAAGIFAATLLTTGTAIGTNIHKALYNSEMSRNIEQEIEDRAVDKILENRLANLDFNGQDFNIRIECDRPELYNVLHNTDLDEILNELDTKMERRILKEYLSNPTEESENELFKKLQGREEELAKFNVDIILASLADSTNVPIKEVSIRTIYKYYNEANGDAIMNGNAPYIGNTLKINNSKFTCEGYVDLPKHITNYSEIPEHLYKLITDAKFNFLTPDSSYFKMGKYPVIEDENSKLERSLEIYTDIKELINDGNFAIKDGKACIVDLEDVEKSPSEEKGNEDDGQDR